METSNGTALMAAAAAETARVLAAAKTAPLDQTTPCSDWDLRTLLNHTILWTAYSAERRAHGETVAEDLMSRDFTADPDYAAEYQAQVGRAVQAWSDSKAWEGDRAVMGNATPAADIAAMLIMETVLHGWDIARAAGQDYNCDDQLAGAVLETIKAQGGMFRKYQGFAAVVPVPGDAPVFDRALALSGRDPRWERRD